MNWSVVIANYRTSFRTYEKKCFKNACKSREKLYRIKKNMLIISGSELQGTVQEVENLRKEVDKLKHGGETDL